MAAALLKTLRLLGDPGRIRLLRLLAREELSVAELQEVLGMGQSRISMQLSQLKHAGLAEVRRSGQNSLYRMTAPQGSAALVAELLRKAAEEIAEAAEDDESLRLVLRKRKDRLRGYFDEMAGRFGRNYVPGRSWKALSEMLLTLLPPMTVADLGAGEGTIALMIAQHARKVIAIDNSPKMVEYGAEVARRNGVKNLEYKLGDLEDVPVASSSVDLALFHQTLHHAIHPSAAAAESYRILKPGGRVLVLDLLKHRFEKAREMYGDVWLGFSELELTKLLRQAGFQQVRVAVVDREPDAPHFAALFAHGLKKAH